jgi:hypothetical protein
LAICDDGSSKDGLVSIRVQNEIDQPSYFTIPSSPHLHSKKYRITDARPPECFYVQTIYILSGRIAVASYHPKTDERLEEKILGPNDFVFVPSMEPHSMRNLSDNEDVTFLCCIANIYEDEGI